MLVYQRVTISVGNHTGTAVHSAVKHPILFDAAIGWTWWTPSSHSTFGVHPAMLTPCHEPGADRQGSHDISWSMIDSTRMEGQMGKNPLWLHCRILVDSDKFQLNQCQTYFFNYKFQLNKFQLNSCCWYPLIVFEILTSSDSNIQVLGSRLPMPDDPAEVATTTRMPYSAGVMADPCLGFAQE